MQHSILLVHTGDEVFVNLDYAYLSNNFHVQSFHVERPFPCHFFKYWKKIKHVDLVFCWFASWNSFWAILISKLLRKPSILVIGGYDVANQPESNYGHQRGGIKKYISRWAMHLANQLTSFSFFSREEAQQNASISPERVQAVYLGVSDPFETKPSVKKEKIVLAVGNVEWVNLKRKGWEPFVRSAAFLPDFEFVLVGKWLDDSIDYLQSIATSNVSFTGRISDDELQCYYQRALVYVQASSHEGFGLSVAEAMLARCIPVVSRIGSLPEVVGDCGVYLPSCEPEDIAKAIHSISYDQEMGEIARQRILTNFPPKKRETELKVLVNSILNASD